MQLHIPYLLGKIKLNEICPQDKKKFKNRTDLCPKGKRTNGTLGFMRGAHPSEIKKNLKYIHYKKLIDMKNLLVIKELIKL